MQRTATKKIYLVLNRDHYADEGATKFYVDIQMWKPGEDSDDVLLRTIEIEESVYLTEEDAVLQQCGQYDIKQEREKTESAMRIAQTEELRKTLLALPHLPPQQDEGVTEQDVRDAMGTLAEAKTQL